MDFVILTISKINKGTYLCYPHIYELTLQFHVHNDTINVHFTKLQQHRSQNSQNVPDPENQKIVYVHSITWGCDVSITLGLGGSELPMLAVVMQCWDCWASYESLESRSGLSFSKLPVISKRNVEHCANTFHILIHVNQWKSS